MQVLLECCYIWMESSRWENWNHLFCRKVSFLTAPHCQFTSSKNQWGTIQRSHHFESFTVATMTWLTVMEYLCHKWPRICSTCRNISRSFPRSWLITGFVIRLTRRVPLVEQEPLTLPEHLSSPQVFSGVHVTRSLVLYVCFVDRCLSFCTFSFGYCVVCSSSIYGFCPEKTTDLSQVTDKLYYKMLYTSPWSRFEPTTSVF
jgi:hypothetical protein